MDTALPQKFPFILDRNLANANCTGNRVCTSCDTVVLGERLNKFVQDLFFDQAFILFYIERLQGGGGLFVARWNTSKISVT